MPQRFAPVRLTRAEFEVTIRPQSVELGWPPDRVLRRTYHCRLARSYGPMTLRGAVAGAGGGPHRTRSRQVRQRLGRLGVPQIWARWAIVTGPFLLFEEATGLVLAVYDVEGDEIEFSLG